MTDRERELASLGFEYAEGIENANVIVHPLTGREIRKTANRTWEAQPHNDNYWREFNDLLDAIKFATPPKKDISDPNYVPTLDEAIIDPNGFVKGMREVS